MRRGFHWVDVPGDGPPAGWSWSWRWVTEGDWETRQRIGIALVWPGRALFCLWRESGPLNTMRVVRDP